MIQNLSKTTYIKLMDLVRKKRDHQELGEDEIRFFIEQICEGTIPEYIIASFLMTVYLNGMTFEETYLLTEAMIQSGQPFTWEGIDGFKADKHSTGGVGDKTSLTTAALAASFGLKVPMISGRTLGHTGGTIDKLESIAGFRTDLSKNTLNKILKDVGAFIISQSKEIVPADSILYSYRNLTSTVESIPLIASSIMSKKLSENLDGLVLDVTVGNGAFMKDIDRAKELANYMIEIGKMKNCKVTVLITDMNQPVGHMVGNAVEVAEAAQILKGEGPQDLKQLCLEITAYMLIHANLFQDVDTAMRECEKRLKDQTAFKIASDMIAAQGGDPEHLKNYYLFPQAQKEYQIRSIRSGYITHINTEAIGYACAMLGGGRYSKTDTIDHSVSVEIKKKIGGYVEAHETLFTVMYNKEDNFLKATSMLEQSLTISDNPVEPPPLIYEVLQ